VLFIYNHKLRTFVVGCVLTASFE